MATPHLYQSLPLNHIRVLQISPKDASDQIRCSLHTVDLNARPVFTALSYVWGGYSSPPHKIDCNGNAVSVTDNCHSALWHLRERLGAFTIWVDAVCIDQDSLAEKSSQIPLMGRIYEQAGSVFIWLGPATTSSTRVMQYLSTWGLRRHKSAKPRFGLMTVPNRIVQRYIIPRAAQETRATQGWDAQNHEYAWHKFVRRLVISIFWPVWHPIPLDEQSPLDKYRKQWPVSLLYQQPYAYISELVELFSQQWISRIWTYQELIFATQPIVVCGTSHLHWDELVSSLFFLSSLPFEELRLTTSRWENLVIDRAHVQGVDIAHCEYMSRKGLRIYLLIRLVPAAIRPWAALLFLVVGAVALAIGLRVDSHYLVPGIIILAIGSCLATWLTIWSCGLQRSLLRTTLVGAQGRLAFKSSTEGLARILNYRTSTQPLDMAYGVWAILEKRGAALSAPTYDRATSEVFHELTTNVLSLSNSLECLFLAALFPLHNAPSWVPDWTKQSNDLQSYMPESSIISYQWRQWRSNKAGFEMSRDFESLIHKELQTTVWSVSGDILTVQAHCIGLVKRSDSLYATAHPPLDEDDAKHTTNARVLRNIASSIANGEKALLSLAIARLSTVTPTPPKQQLAEWVQRVMDPHADWRTESPVLRELHVLICNCNADYNEKVSVGKLSGGRDHVATATNALTGDLIIRIKGLHVAFTMRGLGSPKHVKIIGTYTPLMTQWQDMEPRIDLQEVSFEEYLIH